MTSVRNTGRLEKITNTGASLFVFLPKYYYGDFINEDKTRGILATCGGRGEIHREF